MSRRTSCFFLLLTWIIVFPVCFASGVDSASNVGDLKLSEKQSAINFTPVVGDISVVFLGNIFGVVDGVLAGNGSQIAGQLFGLFNAAVLALAGMLVFYTLLVSTMNTAQDGQNIGKRWSSVFVPIRSIAGITLLLPKVSGYCVLQIFIMWVVVQGIGAADKVWSSALSYLNRGGTIIRPNVDPITNMQQNGNTDVFNAAYGMLTGQVCMAALYKKLDAYQTSYSASDTCINGDYTPNGAIENFCKTPVPNFINSVDFVTDDVLDVQPNDCTRSSDKAPVAMPNFSSDVLPYDVFNGVCGTVKFCNFEAPDNMGLTHKEKATVSASRAIAINQMYVYLTPLAEMLVENAPAFNASIQCNETKCANEVTAENDWGVPLTLSLGYCKALLNPYEKDSKGTWSDCNDSNSVGGYMGNCSLDALEAAGKGINDWMNSYGPDAPKSYNSQACLSWELPNGALDKPVLLRGTELQDAVATYNGMMSASLYLNSQSSDSANYKKEREFISKARQTGWLLAGAYYFRLAILTSQVLEQTGSHTNDDQSGLEVCQSTGGDSSKCGAGTWSTEALRKFFVSLKDIQNTGGDGCSILNAKGNEYTQLFCSLDGDNSTIDDMTYHTIQLISGEEKASQKQTSIPNFKSDQLQQPVYGVSAVNAPYNNAQYIHPNSVYGYLINGTAVVLPGQPGKDQPQFVLSMDYNAASETPTLGEQSIKGGKWGVPGQVIAKIFNFVVKYFFNFLVELIVPMINMVIFAFLQPPVILLASVFLGAMEVLKDPNVNPILALANMGVGFIEGSANSFLIMIGVGIGAAVLGSAALSLMMALLPVVMMWLGIMTGVGITATYYLPLIPFTVFLFASIGWLVGVVEAMVAAPLMAIGVMQPDGEHPFGRSDQAYMLLLGIFLRPSMMVIGYIFGIILSYVGIWLVNAGFAIVSEEVRNLPRIDTASKGITKTISSIGSQVFGNNTIYGMWSTIFLFFFMLLTYISTIIAVVNKAFELIYHVPDKIMRWIQGGQESDLGASATKTMMQDVKKAHQEGEKNASATVAKFASSAMAEGMKYGLVMVELGKEAAKLAASAAAGMEGGGGLSEQEMGELKQDAQIAGLKTLKKVQGKDKAFNALIEDIKNLTNNDAKAKSYGKKHSDEDEDDDDDDDDDEDEGEKKDDEEENSATGKQAGEDKNKGLNAMVGGGAQAANKGGTAPGGQGKSKGGKKTKSKKRGSGKKGVLGKAFTAAKYGMKGANLAAGLVTGKTQRKARRYIGKRISKAGHSTMKDIKARAAKNDGTVLGRLAQGAAWVDGRANAAGSFGRRMGANVGRIGLKAFDAKRQLGIAAAKAAKPGYDAVKDTADNAYAHARHWKTGKWSGGKNKGKGDRKVAREQRRQLSHKDKRKKQREKAKKAKEDKAKEKDNDVLSASVTGLKEGDKPDVESEDGTTTDGDANDEQAEIAAEAAKDKAARNAKERKEEEDEDEDLEDDLEAAKKEKIEDAKEKAAEEELKDLVEDEAERLGAAVAWGKDEGKKLEGNLKNADDLLDKLEAKAKKGKLSDKEKKALTMLRAGKARLARAEKDLQESEDRLDDLNDKLDDVNEKILDEDEKIADALNKLDDKKLSKEDRAAARKQLSDAKKAKKALEKGRKDLVRQKIVAAQRVKLAGENVFNKKFQKTRLLEKALYGDDSDVEWDEAEMAKIMDENFDHSKDSFNGVSGNLYSLQGNYDINGDLCAESGLDAAYNFDNNTYADINGKAAIFGDVVSGVKQATVRESHKKAFAKQKRLNKKQRKLQRLVKETGGGIGTKLVLLAGAKFAKGAVDAIKYSEKLDNLYYDVFGDNDDAQLKDVNKEIDKREARKVQAQQNMEKAENAKAKAKEKLDKLETEKPRKADEPESKEYKTARKELEKAKSDYYIAQQDFNNFHTSLTIDGGLYAKRDELKQEIVEQKALRIAEGKTIQFIQDRDAEYDGSTFAAMKGETKSYFRNTWNNRGEIASKTADSIGSSVYKMVLSGRSWIADGVGAMAVKHEAIFGSSAENEVAKTQEKIADFEKKSKLSSKDSMDDKLKSLEDAVKQIDSEIKDKDDEIAEVEAIIAAQDAAELFEELPFAGEDEPTTDSEAIKDTEADKVILPGGFKEVNAARYVSASDPKARKAALLWKKKTQEVKKDVLKKDKATALEMKGLQDNLAKAKAVVRKERLEKYDTEEFRETKALAAELKAQIDAALKEDPDEDVSEQQAALAQATADIEKVEHAINKEDYDRGLHRQVKGHIKGEFNKEKNAVIKEYARVMGKANRYSTSSRILGVGKVTAGAYLGAVGTGKAIKYGYKAGKYSIKFGLVGILFGLLAPGAITQMISNQAGKKMNSMLDDALAKEGIAVDKSGNLRYLNPTVQQNVDPGDSKSPTAENTTVTVNGTKLPKPPSAVIQSVEPENEGEDDGEVGGEALVTPQIPDEMKELRAVMKLNAEAAAQKARERKPKTPPPPEEEVVIAPVDEVIPDELEDTPNDMQLVVRDVKDDSEQLAVATTNTDDALVTSFQGSSPEVSEMALKLLAGSGSLASVYRKMALELHPDKNKGMDKLAEAYKLLTDIRKEKPDEFQALLTMEPADRKALLSPSASKKQELGIARQGPSISAITDGDDNDEHGLDNVDKPLMIEDVERPLMIMDGKADEEDVTEPEVDEPSEPTLEPESSTPLHEFQQKRNEILGTGEDDNVSGEPILEATTEPTLSSNNAGDALNGDTLDKDAYEVMLQGKKDSLKPISSDGTTTKPKELNEFQKMREKITKKAGRVAETKDDTARRDDSKPLRTDTPNEALKRLRKTPKSVDKPTAEPGQQHEFQKIKLKPAVPNVESPSEDKKTNDKAVVVANMDNAIQATDKSSSPEETGMEAELRLNMDSLRQLNENLGKSDSDLVAKAYRNLSKTYHPDKGGNAEDFKELKAARDKLIETASTEAVTPLNIENGPTADQPPEAPLMIQDDPMRAIKTAIKEGDYKLKHVDTPPVNPLDAALQKGKEQLKHVEPPVEKGPLAPLPTFEEADLKMRMLVETQEQLTELSEANPENESYKVDLERVKVEKAILDPIHKEAHIHQIKGQLGQINTDIAAMNTRIEAQIQNYHLAVEEGFTKEEIGTILSTITSLKEQKAELGSEREAMAGKLVKANEALNKKDE